MASKYGILVDYDWCTGCHSCEVACQMEHNFPLGQFGIMVTELGPWEYKPEVWQFTYIPTPTDQCDQCADRLALGKEPTCVQHCQAECMEYGPLEDLARKLADHPKQVLYAL